MSAVIRPVVTTLLPLVLAAGCAASPPAPFPPRPYPITVESVDPCAALSADQRAGLNLIGGRARSSQGGTSRLCSWIDRQGRSVNLQTFPQPASAAIGADPTSRIVTVAGFGAVTSRPVEAGSGSFCQFVLDVADGASLRSQLAISPSALAPPDDAVACRELEAITARMLETLRARQPS